MHPRLQKPHRNGQKCSEGGDIGFSRTTLFFINTSRYCRHLQLPNCNIFPEAEVWANNTIIPRRRFRIFPDNHIFTNSCVGNDNCSGQN